MEFGRGKWLVALLIGITLVGGADGAEPPNVVVVLVDDLRWDEIGCMGHSFVRTPHIDRIAREGMKFRNAFTPAPLCSPARAALLTGLNVSHHGIRDNTNRSEQSHGLVTFPKLLQDAGYETAYVGKWHMGNDDSARPGFDRWVGIKGQGTSFDPELNVDGKRVTFVGHTTDVLNRHAVEFVKKERDPSTDSGQRKPFCLYLAHKALHPELVQRDDGSISDPEAARFLPAKRHETLYAEVAVPWRLNVLDDLEGKPALLREIEGLPHLSRETGTSDETVRDRLRMLAGVDEGVGMLFDALEETGELEETVFVFTSDHGYWYGEHGLSVERRLAYEEGIRIPLLVRYPAMVTEGSVVDAMALCTDLAPTVMELAGVSSGPKMDGRSLVPFLQGEVPGDWREEFLIEYNTDTVFPRVLTMGYRALRTERWKLIHYLELEGMDELYDLREDPYEMRNVIAEEKEVALKMREKLGRVMGE